MNNVFTQANKNIYKKFYRNKGYRFNFPSDKKKNIETQLTNFNIYLNNIGISSFWKGKCLKKILNFKNLSKLYQVHSKE